jgi:hypothetical protein
MREELDKEKYGKSLVKKELEEKIVNLNKKVSAYHN